MLEIKNGILKENGYGLSDSAKLGSVFGIGNGYFGLRGSLEELGEVFIQGLYIRGVFDQIVEIPLTFCDNIYMKKYYFDDFKLKDFEKEDSCINVCDPLTIRIFVNGKLFLPWEGKIVSWTRYIDPETGGLVRDVTWDDGEGHKTKFHFERYCSFASNHLILQYCKVTRINHELPVRVMLGVDTNVKTNGQHKSQVTIANNKKGNSHLEFYEGSKYSHRVSLDAKYEASNAFVDEANDVNGIYYSNYYLMGNEAEFKKVISMYASIDPVSNYVKASKDDIKVDYDTALKEHLEAYKNAFDKVDIKIKGHAKADALIRYANYQSLIGFDRFDSVHSLSAKNLTAEKYNQFVWWDAEIFQLPLVIASFPEAAKHCLEYRYRCMKEGKNIAAKEGYKGCKWAFCSSVKGDENVWIYARHPFLQIHIVGDVAYGCYNYYRQTLDSEFMKKMGLEMMVEACKYFVSRSTVKNGKYHLINVTGTDEHHPYINNDAYTNFEFGFIAKETARLIKKLGHKIDSKTLKMIEDYAENIYLPEVSKDGIIPQFDGYLNLKPYLPIEGNGNGTGFQMKASGLYHLSQIIKQPDVLNLYTYLDCEMPENIYKKNWKYYTKMCEASSSLTYPVHTISAIDFHDNEEFLKNLFNSVEIDIEDIHHCAYQGVHAGCLAGGWYAIYRGIFGIRPREDALYIDPKFDSPFKGVDMNFMYQGNSYHISLTNKKCVITSNAKTNINIIYKGKSYTHEKETTIESK